VLTEEKLDDIGDRLEHTPRKSLKCLAQETGMSKSSARMATQLLKPSNEKLVFSVLLSARRNVIPVILIKQFLAKNIYM
jgi:hypothetical protein